MTQHSKEREKRRPNTVTRHVAGNGSGRGIGKGKLRDVERRKTGRWKHCRATLCFLHNSGFCNWIFNEGELLISSCPLTTYTVGSYQSLKIITRVKVTEPRQHMWFGSPNLFLSIPALPPHLCHGTHHPLLGQTKNLGVILDFSSSSSLPLPTANPLAHSIQSLFPKYIWIHLLLSISADALQRRTLTLTCTTAKAS